MENNKNKKSVKFQGDMFNFCDFIQVSVISTNHHLKYISFPYHEPGRVAQSVACLTQEPEVPGPIPDPDQFVHPLNLISA